MVALRGPDGILKLQFENFFFLTIALQEDLGLCISSDFEGSEICGIGHLNVVLY